MNTYIVRPYFGHDCDSEQGFNNGHYLDDITVDANDEQDAIDKAMAEFAASGTVIPTQETETHGSFGDNTIYWEFDHVYVTDDGEQYESEAELPTDPDTDQPVEAECHYLYQYIDFSDVTEATAAKAGAK